MNDLELHRLRQTEAAVRRNAAAMRNEFWLRKELNGMHVQSMESRYAGK